jgi:hypothetical protein
MVERAKRFGCGRYGRRAGAVLAAAVLLRATRFGGGGWLDPVAFVLLILGLGLIGAALYAGAAERIDPDSDRPPAHALWPTTWFLLLLLVLYSGSSAIGDNWFFPTNWKSPESLASRPLGSGFVRSLFLALGLALGFKPLLRSSRFLALAWIGLAGLALIHLHALTGFSMIYRMDSPAFVYRFWSFLHTFPHPVFYDPHWNAGLPATALVATGIWSVGPWLLPFLAWIPAEQLYTPYIAFVFLGLLPLLAWWSLAWTGAGRRACWIAALLALAPGQRYWVHMLHYGTSTALFAMCMAMPLAALGYKFLYRDPRPRPATLILLLLCGYTFLSWPGSLIVAVPFLLVTVFHVRRLFPGKWPWLLGGMALLFLMLIQLALVPMRYSPVAKFLETTSQLTPMEHFRAGLGLLGHNLRSTHALILVLGFMGSFFAPRRSARRFFAPLILMLVILSGWGEEVKKLLQTERLIIPAELIAIIPAAGWLDQIIRRALAIRPKRNFAGAALRTGAAWGVAILLLGGYQGAKTWKGNGLMPFQAMPDATKELVAWLSAHVPEDGRVMFAGRAVHAYGGAKIAALPLFTGREMMAADYYGFSPKLVEYQYPPRPFRYDGPDVLFSFMDLYNVTHVVTWHDDWKKTFHQATNHYRSVHVIGRTEIFETLRASTLFLKGTGRVRATFDRFDLDLETPQETLVLKYNWVPGWQAEAGVRLFPYDAGREVTLIGVEPGTNLHAVLRYRP